MSDTFQVPPPAPVPVTLPEVAWIGGHPTVADPETRGTRLRRCVRCNARSEFYSVSCEPGMIVHLIDHADVHANPEVFDGVQWAEPQVIDRSHAHWRDKGFKITRKPDGNTDENAHPRFRPCPRCNEEAMAAGTLAPVHLPTVETPPQGRGRSGR